MSFRGKTATAIIPFEPNLILLNKRLTPPFIGYWALPGGRSEPGETSDQTIIREVKEETGLDIAIVTKIGDYHEKGNQGGFEYDYYPTCFIVEPIGGNLTKQETEIEKIQLFDLKLLPKVLAFEHNQMVKDYQQILNKKIL